MSEVIVNTVEDSEIIKAAREIAYPLEGFASKEQLEEASDRLGDMFSELTDKGLLQEYSDEWQELTAIIKYLSDMDTNWIEGNVQEITPEDWEAMMDATDEDDEDEEL
jgi:hypothetical protein